MVRKRAVKPVSRRLVAAACVFCLALAAGTPATAQSDPLRTALDVRYDDSPGSSARLNSLDIYAPPNAKDLPVVIFVHGGGWMVGDKRGSVGHKPERFTAEGYLFVSINYRLSPKVRHPVHVQDVARAIAWVHENAGRYGGDGECIFLIGHSAGAHLVALVATDQRRLKEAGVPLGAIMGVVPLDTGGYDIPLLMELGRDTRLRATYEVPFGDDPETWKDASPITYVSSAPPLPPFLLVHAGERVASRIGSERFASAVRKAGGQATTYHARDKDHATLNGDLGRAGDEPTQRILEFFRDCRSTLGSPAK